ncbi:hypothetical protein M413DRAFT_24731 [Hebeloma cylindrosporum]|uniref:F-box domain-containing protein n=1 Tax=Hebeloma cylindrosporum TaxID=76867 RepID=A0A0C3CN50_HEBCY|nr:hypothetical protein M413DRAFT_24731 [Hebeloma cylindrosporum h7]
MLGKLRSAFPATPFPQLLRSNFAPSTLEFSAVSKAIFSAEALRSSLNSQIIESEVSASLVWKAMTRYKIQRLGKFIAAHKGVVSAIRRIPPEIIQEIFQWLNAILRQRAQLQSTLGLPFAYGQISHSWRASALSVHSLWSVFSVVRNPKSRRGRELQVKYMTELLRRSRQAPIQMFIDVDAIYHIRHLLARCSERWQVLTICGWSVQMLSNLCGIRGRLPNLETLTILFRSPGTFFGALDLFKTAPKLRDVTLVGYDRSAVELPTRQLVDFCSITSGIPNPLNQLTNAYHLENLTYGIWHADRITKAVFLPSLKRLHLREHHPSLPVLDFLTVPFLEYLRISVVQKIDGTLLRSIAKMASRSESGNLPYLGELRIESEHDKMSKGMDEVLRVTPALRVLETPNISSHDTLTHSFINDRTAAKKRKAGDGEGRAKRRCNEFFLILSDPVRNFRVDS